jgi:hypothetical protein
MTGRLYGGDDRGRPPDGELARLRTLWLRVVASAVADQDDDWMRGGVMSGRDLVLEAAGIEPGWWDRVMLPVADAIRAERARARSEHREPRPIVPGAPAVVTSGRAQGDGTPGGVTACRERIDHDASPPARHGADRPTAGAP